MDRVSNLSRIWRYINGIKFSTTVAAIENFSIREPSSKSLERLFSAVGRELGEFIIADRYYHIFSNPDLGELHFMECIENSSYQKMKTIVFRYEFDKINPLKWSLFTFRGKEEKDKSAKIAEFNPDDDTFPLSLKDKLRNPKHIALAPFCKSDTPLGYFLFCWDSDELPMVFMEGEEGEDIREGAISILNYTHDLVTRLISNHFPIHRDTYIPSFQKRGVRPACVLFADIRNFTSAFEISRLMGTSERDYPRLLVGFVKAYLEAASIIISQPGIGRIDKFIGDGIMATFNDQVNLT